MIIIWCSGDEVLLRSLFTALRNMLYSGNHYEQSTEESAILCSKTLLIYGYVALTWIGSGYAVRRRFLQACLLSWFHEVGLSEAASVWNTEILLPLHGVQGSLSCLLELFTGFLSWGSWIKSISSNSVYVRSILILSFHFCLGLRKLFSE